MQSPLNDLLAAQQKQLSAAEYSLQQYFATTAGRELPAFYHGFPASTRPSSATAALSGSGSAQPGTATLQDSILDMLTQSTTSEPPRRGGTLAPIPAKKVRSVLYTPNTATNLTAADGDLSSSLLGPGGNPFDYAALAQLAQSMGYGLVPLSGDTAGGARSAPGLPTPPPSLQP
eukprot:RCo036408